MKLLTALLIISLLSLSTATTLEAETCDPGRMRVEVDYANADVVIGGIFEMRNPGDDEYGCGRPHPEIMLSYEATRWAIRRVNQNNYIPGVRLGMIAYDTCYQPTRAMEAVTDFYPQYSSMYCSDTGKLKLGFLGPGSSWTTKPAAEMASQFPVSMISPGASSPDLSDKTKYPYFLRTGLSSAEQTESMIALMKELGWERVLLTYAENDYGRDAVKEFVRQSQTGDVCVVDAVALPSQGTVNEYFQKVKNLNNYDVNGAVFFGTPASLTPLMAALKLNETRADLQWMLSLVNMQDDVLSNHMYGAIFVQPRFTEVTEFFQYFTNDIDERNPPNENPWYQDWFMTTFNCKLSGIDYAPYVGLSDCTSKSPAIKRAAINTQFSFVDSAIMAVYAYAKALKVAQSNLCRPNEICDPLREMTAKKFHDDYLKPVNFNFNEVGLTSLRDRVVQFDVNGDLKMSTHDFWNYNNQPTGPFMYKNVGSYSSKTLNVNLNDIYMYNRKTDSVLPSLPTSPCPADGCRNCLHPKDMVHFTFVPGDIIIGGLFDIHGMGSEVLTCGKIKPSHALEAAAFRFAFTPEGQIPLKNQFGQQNFLQGVDLGSLIIDLCDSGETGRLLLNNILGNRHIVRDRNGNVIDPYRIKSVVGTLDSTEAISVAHNLGEFMMPQLEAAATSNMLSNRMYFPYFSRVVPSDVQQIRGIVMLLNRFGWKYIQVIHSGDDYGRTGAMTLRDLGAEKSICIAAAHEVRDDYATVVRNLKNKPEAKIVVGILDSDEYRMVLQEMKDQGFTSDDFRLIGTETWGQKDSIVAGLSDIADGAISMEIVSPTLSQFRSWLRGQTMDIEKMKKMPFLVEWYEYAFNCYIDAGNRGVYTQQCLLNQDIMTAPNYQETPYTQFIISATYAVSRALHLALEHYCGVGYDGVCWEFRAAPDIKEKVREYIRDAEFQLENGQPFKIKDGEGVSNYAIYNYRNGAYSQIGTFLTETNHLDINANIYLGNYESRCSGVCGECVYLLQQAPFTVLEGHDLMMGINFAIHNPGVEGDPFNCGSMRLTNGFQSSLAAALALRLINSKQAPVSLNGVEVGGLLFDHCNSPARAYGLPSALYAGVLETKMEHYSPDLNAIRAWMTDNTLVTEEMKEFFQDLNLPVISPMATSNKFLDEDEYPTFLRTIPGDSTIATALAILAKSLGFQYVTLVYSANSFGHGGKDAFYQIAQQEGVCVIKAFELGPHTNTTKLMSSLVSQSTHVVVTYLGRHDMETFIDARARNPAALENLVVFSTEPYAALYSQKGLDAKNILSLGMKARDMAAYRSFLMNLDYERIKEHPGIVEYYQDLFKCNLPGNYKYASDCPMPLDKITEHPGFFVDNYVLSTMNAIYTFVAGAHETLKEQCGEDYNGVCSKFYSDPHTNTILLRRMKQVNFVDASGTRFDFIGNEGSTSRDIHLFDGNSMSLVGEFAGASVNFMDNDFMDRYKLTESKCELPCGECIMTNMNFTYIPGDILIGGIFDVHEADVSPFSCGQINTLRGFQLLEAFHFALQKVNDKSGMFKDILKNIRLGGVGLDACQSAIKGGYMVSNIHNGLTELQRNGITIDPDDIDAYVGSYSSGRSVYLARLMKTLKIPQISFGSTSTDLLDRDRFPFFLRTVPADDYQTMAMVKFLRKYDVRYVQVVHTADNYGESGARKFAETAEAHKICVAQTVAFTDKSVVTQESANDVVVALLEKPIANTVVIFADASFVHELLRAIGRNPEAYKKFRFIGSDSWANNKEATDGVEDIAVDSVTFDLDTKDLKDFDNYLSSKSPGNYPENPWFSEYYEDIFNCYLTIPDRRFPGRCPATAQDIVTSTRYKQDTAIIHVINAVFAAAIGTDMALKEICGESYTTVCEAFKNNATRRELVLRKIKEAEFTDLSGHEFSFEDNRGDSNRGYTIYSIDTETELGYIYNPIGEYTSDGKLNIEKDNYKPSWDGSCNREDSCTECPTIRNLVTRFMLDPYQGVDDPATLVALMNIHGQGVDEYRCGEFYLLGFLRALAVKFTIEELLPGQKPFDLRTLILDNCDNQLRIDQDLFNLLSTGTLCNTNFDAGNTLIDIGSVIGVFTGGSRFVVAANRVTAPLKIQLLSSVATSTALSERWKYPYFARTVPPDNIMMEIVAKILKENDWSYVGVIHSDESYGINGYKTLRDIVNEGQYSCIGSDLTIPASGTVEELRPLVKQLHNLNGIGVIVAIVVDPRPLLEAAVAEGVADKFVWIGLDAWGNFKSITEDLVDKFRGAITIYFRDAIMQKFVNYVKELKYGDPTNPLNDENNRKYIPDDWFEEFYQHIHECHLPSATIVVDKFERECQLNENITAEQVSDVQVGILDIAAAYAVGKGLQGFVSQCGAGETISECMKGLQNSRDKLFERTLSQTWPIHEVVDGLEPRGERFNLAFNSERFWNSGYRVYNLKDGNNYVEVGRLEEDEFIFDKDGYEHYRDHDVVSKCPEDQFCECNFATGTKPLQTKPKYMGAHQPRNYYVYDKDTQKQVYEWPVWAIAVSVCTCVGLLILILLFFYFLIFYPVRGGTTILGFIMMIGTMAIYAINFAFFLPASEATCGIREFFMGVVYCIVFAALFVKSVDDWRFKHREYSAKNYKGISNPLSLFLITLGIVLVQCIIPTEWLIVKHPSASLMADSTAQHDWMWCDPHDFYDISIVLSMIFVMFLVLLTAIFAALAWDSESNYYEARWIFVACVCTAGCFMVWMIVSTNAGPPFRDPAVAIGNFFNATALLICIPIRKLVLLFMLKSEEEKSEMMPYDEQDKEMYSTVYTNQTYEPDVFQAPGSGDSKVSSEPGF